MPHKIRIIVGPNGYMPTKAHPSDAGFDLYASENYAILPGAVAKVSTDISVNVGDGWEAQVRSRSGLASRGVVVANSPGTIDAGYTGEVKVLLANAYSDDIAYVNKGDRIAQLVVQRVEDAVFERVYALPDTDRGQGGFGSTGST